MPEVSVVIPTRNRWRSLQSLALRSALEQQDVDLEVIVVDDGSTDGTAERLQALRDSRVRLISVTTQHGPSHARNLGIAAAKGAFIAFLDDDDAWSPQKLRRQLDVAQTRDADFVYSSVVIIDQWRLAVRRVPAPDPTTLYSALLSRNALVAGPSTVLVRTHLLRSLGGFDEQMFAFEDWDMWLRLARVGRAAMCGEVLTAHLVYHGDSATRSVPDVTTDFRRLAQKHALATTWYSKPEIADARWRAFAHRRAGRPLLAAGEYWRAGWQHRRPELLLRGIAVLIGESAMQLGDRHSLAKSGAPQWLDRYR